MRSEADDHQTVCLSCGSRMTPSLVRAASPRCIDCRDTNAPLRADLVERRAVR